MKFIVTLILSMFLLTGCSMLKSIIPAPITRIINPTYTKSNNYEYQYYKDAKAGIVYKTVQKSSEKSVPKQTAMAKLGGWISKLSFITFIVIALGLFLAPSATISFLWFAKRRIGIALAETVKAIKTSAAVREDVALHNALASTQSVTTKQIVTKLKNKV